MTLFARTHFSIGESMLKIDDITDAAVDMEEKTVALCDTMTISGMIEMTKKCDKKDIKVVVGTRLRIVDDLEARGEDGKTQNKGAWYPKVWAKNEEGIKAIYRLLSLANTPENFYYIPRLSLDQLIEEIETGALIFSTGDSGSLLKRTDALSILRKIMSADRSLKCFVELCPVNIPYWDKLNHRGIVVAEKLKLQTLLTRHAFYKKGMAGTAEVLDAICSNTQVTRIFHKKPHNRDLHPMIEKSLILQAQEAKARIQRRYPKTDQGLAWKVSVLQSRDFGDHFDYKWKAMDVSLPPMSEDEFLTLTEECKKGWTRRLTTVVFGHKPNNEDLLKKYKPRLIYELGVLKKMGFSGYFLLVQDMVRWSRDNDIATGPGRGSVGGSLIAFLMEITDVDPIRFDLIFERFINPDRIDLPDIDLDFMSTRRGDTIQYLTDKYGEENVAGISNYSMLGPASCIRDTGRVYELPDRDYACSKLVPDEHGTSVELESAATMEIEIENFRDLHPVQWGHAVNLQGCMRSLSRHAGGVVIAGEPLVNRSVVERRSSTSVINWDKRVAEDQGLIKIDVLGLSTLDILTLAKEYVFERHSVKLDLTAVPLNDPDIMENFSKGITVGVFQFESAGMRKLLKDLGKLSPLTFEDVTAATALFRPGPMDSGMMEQYVSRKNGYEDIYYENPNMEDALKETYGVAVYQEQVMALARDVAGFSLSDADGLRKAMGKKSLELMETYKEQWIKGCMETSEMETDSAEALYDKIAAFAGYGFNKSHAAAYSMISYQAMYLKTKYPIEFFAATLTVMNKEDKISAIIRDAKKFGIEIFPPDINISSDRFEILNDTTLCAPFDKVKGVSTTTASAIVAARTQPVTVSEHIAGTARPKKFEDVVYPAGPFKNKENFLKRIEKRRCNSKQQDVLDKVGAFARIEPLQLPPRHPDRGRDQATLLQGLSIDPVKVDREIDGSREIRSEIMKVVEDCDEASKGYAVIPAFGKKPKFMVVSDCPTWSEEESSPRRFTEGKSFEYMAEALRLNGLAKSDGYWTGLLKVKKADKFISNEELKFYTPYLKREVEIVKPPIIILMGSGAIRHFIKGFKGSAADSAGMSYYDEELDATLFVGFNPAQISFNPEMQENLNELFAVVKETVDK